MLIFLLAGDVGSRLTSKVSLGRERKQHCELDIADICCRRPIGSINDGWADVVAKFTRWT